MGIGINKVEVKVEDLIPPYFVTEGRDKRESISAMPGIYRLSIDNLIKDIQESRSLGIKAFLLFGVSKKKDAYGTEAYQEDGLVQEAVRTIKKKVTGVTVITDVCLCGYTSHGHCGIIRAQNAKRKTQNVVIDNTETLKVLSKIALSHAQAGADFVAPSAMAKLQVKAIRERLDKSGLKRVKILAYSAKFASNFYGPFRNALDSSPRFGDRKGYQLDFHNPEQAIEEIESDIKEGADIVMVKPALAYLDIIQRAKEKFSIPIAAYNVSAEYAMLKAYCQRTEDRRPRTERDLVLEILTSIKRAGADLIITYYARDVAKWLTH